MNWEEDTIWINLILLRSEDKQEGFKIENNFS